MPSSSFISPLTRSTRAGDSVSPQTSLSQLRKDSSPVEVYLGLKNGSSPLRTFITALEWININSFAKRIGEEKFINLVSGTVTAAKNELVATEETKRILLKVRDDAYQWNAGGQVSLQVIPTEARMLLQWVYGSVTLDSATLRVRRRGTLSDGCTSDAQMVHLSVTALKNTASPFFVDLSKGFPTFASDDTSAKFVRFIAREANNVHFLARVYQSPEETAAYSLKETVKLLDGTCRLTTINKIAGDADPLKDLALPSLPAELEQLLAQIKIGSRTLCAENITKLLDDEFDGFRRFALPLLLDILGSKNKERERAAACLVLEKIVGELDASELKKTAEILGKSLTAISKILPVEVAFGTRLCAVVKAIVTSKKLPSDVTNALLTPMEKFVLHVEENVAPSTATREAITTTLHSIGSLGVCGDPAIHTKTAKTLVHFINHPATIASVATYYLGLLKYAPSWCTLLKKIPAGPENQAKFEDRFHFAEHAALFAQGSPARIDELATVLKDYETGLHKLALYGEKVRIEEYCASVIQLEIKLLLQENYTTEVDAALKKIHNESRRARVNYRTLTALLGYVEKVPHDKFCLDDFIKIGRAELPPS